MGICSRILSGLALGSVLFAAPLAAQDEGSVQVGNATVSVGGGTAILTLPDVEFTKINDVGGALPFFVVGRLKDSDDFGDEYGWNVGASVGVPVTDSSEFSLKGFWAHIEDDGSQTCTSSPNARCEWVSIVDDPDEVQSGGISAVGSTARIASERDVDQWGLALEGRRITMRSLLDATPVPSRWYVALGADIRGVDQDLMLRTSVTGFGADDDGPLAYSEELDTRYYGAYLAIGGDYAPFLFRGLSERWGLQSSFQLRGGVYCSDADYAGRYVNTAGNEPDDFFTQTLSLTESDTAFIGGLTLEIRKNVGPRAILSLKSDYEYYSWVPEMRYNDVDTSGVSTFRTGPHDGTSIGEGAAFSARTSLRLTIKLGPDHLFEESL